MVLQIIRPGARITMDNGLDAVGVAVILQIDPEAGIRENGVAEQRVVDGGGVMHPDSGKKGTTAHQIASAVEGDDVASTCCGATYRIAGSVADEEAARIAQWLCACDIRPDDVAREGGAGGAGPEDHPSFADVARDQIAGRCTGSSRQPADDVIRRAIDIDAYIWIAQGNCSGYVRANEVALHRVGR